LQQGPAGCSLDRRPAWPAQVLYLTDPEHWSPHAVYQATRLFVSSLNARLAQRFLALVLLPHVRQDIRENRRLHFALFQAMKKAAYKPDAFYKARRRAGVRAGGGAARMRPARLAHVCPAGVPVRVRGCRVSRLPLVSRSARRPGAPRRCARPTRAAAARRQGLLLPLCASGTCTLREAVIVSSVLRRVSVPVLHSAAALLRLAEMPYSGTTSFFIRVLLDKKYALPYRVVDALVDHFVRFRREERTLPVVWHQALLCFVQRCGPAKAPALAAAPAAGLTARSVCACGRGGRERSCMHRWDMGHRRVQQRLSNKPPDHRMPAARTRYKNEIRAADKEELRRLAKSQYHYLVTPEVLREMDASRCASPLEWYWFYGSCPTVQT